ncbi:MAG: hypothetical protein Q9195_006346 [Heterodermia aff. obscurata]
MTASVRSSSVGPSLWDQAFNSLDNALRSSLSSTRTHKRDILEATLKEIEAKKDLAIRKRWKLKKPNGDIIVVRDLLEKIARWIYRFKETGDVIAQYDPAHLSLPWAAFRFLLQISVSEVQVFGAMADNLEIIARIVTRYQKFERLYLQGTKSDLELLLEKSLVRLYVEILTHLARAVRFFGEKSIVRWIKSPFRTVDDKQMHQILAEEAEVLKIAKLTDTDKLVNLEAAVTRLSVEANMYSQSLSEQKYGKVWEWLSALPCYDYHQFISQSRLTNLGKWLLNDKDYIDWQSSSSPSLLLVHGITGSGKSMLCSMIVDSLLLAAKNDPSAAPFGYIYCANPDFEKPSRSSDDVMRSILCQLALDRNDRRTIKDFLYSEYERQIATARVDGLELPKLRMQDCIRLVLELAEHSPLTIIIDAIDAVKDSERHTLASALKEIVLKADNVVKILITSRSSNRAAIEAAANKQIQITSHETKQDMECFVNRLIENVVTNKMLLDGRVSSELCNMLKEKLLDGAGEMFLWVKLQIERLCREKIEDDVLIALENNLPEDLDQLYQESLSHIFGTGKTARDAAVKILSWILHMREPLTPSALLTAVSNGQKSIMQLPELMALCASLVVLDKNRNILRFAHQSVKDFLERHDAFTGAVAHNLLASTCIEVCSRGPVVGRSLQYPSDDSHVHAAMYWPIHSKMAESTAANKDTVNNLTSFIFDEDFDTTLSFASWLETRGEIVSILANDHAMKAALDAIPDGDAGIFFLISVFGLTNLLQVVFENVADIDINQKNKHGHTPVYLAAAFGHSAALCLLVHHGADVNIQGGKYGSPLHAACFTGQLEVVQYLLKFDANISCGVVFADACQAACRGGQEGVAFLLIENASIVKSEDDYEKAVEGAARAGFVGIVEKLYQPPFLLFNTTKLDKVRRKTKKAIQGGQLGVIRQFLDLQAIRKDVLPPDAVALATLYNHKILVEFLLDEGMSVEAEGPFGTPLRTACLLNYQPITRLLLHKGAEINASGAFGDALHAAAMKGHTMIVKFLIDEGANVDQQSGFYGTALQAAAYHGQHGAVELLLDAGANIHAEGFSKDAFHAAAEGGHQDLIMMMLRKGYKFYHTPPSPEAMESCLAKPRYKNLLRDTSPGRVPDANRQRESYLAPKDILTKKTRPISEFEAIFNVAEQDSEVPRIHSELIPATGYKPEDPFRHRENYPLETAASAGHKECVEVLLEQREALGISEDEVSHAINVAISNFQWPVIQLLLVDAAKRQSVKPYIESIVELKPQKKQSPIVALALALASRFCSADEIVQIKQSLVAAIDKHEYCLEVSLETLILDFKKACEFGDVEVIDAILASKHHKALSSHDIDAFLQLCAFNDQTAVVQLICESPSLKGRLPHSGEEVFAVAAGNGSLNIMRLLASNWTAELTMPNSIAINRALVVACENGHIDVVRHLVQDRSADINTLAHDKPVGSSINKCWWSVYPFKMTPNVFKDPSPASQVEPTEVPLISPLQAALRGLSIFKPSTSIYDDPLISFDRHKPRKAGRSQHEETIVFLLSHGSKLSDIGGQSIYPTQMAIEFCPIYIVEKFVLPQTDINATIDGRSLLFFAAGRELSSASIVRRLLAAGATIPEKVEEQKELISQALRYFKSDILIDSPDGQFLEAPSLEYVFNEGSAAVLFDLLHLMPQVKAINIEWTLVFQMAALLDNHRFIDLLMSRGTDINATGYYYGTALEAAARCGHINMVQKLLKAGAEVNVIQGRWKTALHAALVGGHAAVVETLLDHGADMTLKLARQELFIIDSGGALVNALQLGVQSGSLSIVKNLLKHGANVVQDENETLHPLILASKHGNSAIVKQLLDFGAPVNIHAKKRTTWAHVLVEDASPMHAAVAGGHLDLVKILLSQGADMETNVEGSGTPLTLAASWGRADIVRLLLAAGANTIDGTALYAAVREGRIEIAQELLAAGSKAEPVLALACRRGFLPMIEILLDKVYDGEKPETVIDEVFAIQKLDTSVVRLLLDYVHPTMQHFVRVCAADSVESVKSLLDRGVIDINGQPEMNGDHPLQVAALHLQVEVAQYLLISGADVDCKSAKHGTPLITALEACAASKLRTIPSERVKKSLDQLCLPDYGQMTDQLCLPGYGPTPYPHFDTSGSSSFQQISNCEHIVELLIIHGANISDDSSPFGSSMHLACLIGSENLVGLLLEKGADFTSTAGYFGKTLFAAIQGGNSNIVELLLQKTPLTKHIHPDFATPLHLACANGSNAAIRKLLEYGADATVLDAKGRTPLTIAIGETQQWDPRFDRSPKESPLEIILKLANPLHIRDEDLVKAAELGYGDAEETIALLLDFAKDMIVSEAVICHILESRYAEEQIIQLLTQRNGGIGVTAKMLTTVKDVWILEELLKHNPIPEITPNILKSQKNLECMELLLEFDHETPVTKEVIFRALEIRPDLSGLGHTSHEQDEREVLEILFDRSPSIVVSQEMLQAVRCAADMEILLDHLEPGTCISIHVIMAVAKLKPEEDYETMRLLLKFDPNIKLNHEMILQMIRYPVALDALEMFLERDPSMSVSEELFLRIFVPYWSNREKLADLLHKYGKCLVFTEKMCEVIDYAYQDASEASKKKRFYSL